MELRIAFKETAVKLIQDGFCQLCVFSFGGHILSVAYLENYFIESFFLFAITDFFVVVFDAAVFAFLLCVELCQSFIEQFVIHLFYGSITILDIQMSAPILR